MRIACVVFWGKINNVRTREITTIYIYSLFGTLLSRSTQTQIPCGAHQKPVLTARSVCPKTSPPNQPKIAPTDTFPPWTQNPETDLAQNESKPSEATRGAFSFFFLFHSPVVRLCIYMSFFTVIGVVASQKGLLCLESNCTSRYIFEYTTVLTNYKKNIIAFR